MFEYELSETMQDLIDSAVYVFGLDIEPTEQEVWDIARKFAEPPITTNIYLALFFEKLISELEDINPALEFDWETNCYASYFNYKLEDEDDFTELYDVEELVNKLKEKRK